MFNLLKGLFKGINPIKEVADVVDRFTESKDDKRAFFKEVYEMQAKDRGNARNLYGKDSTVQKIYAVVFLIAYVGLTCYFIYWAVNHSGMHLTEFQISIISSVWGAMSAKVSTVTDFFFGASESNVNDKNKPLDHIVN